MAESGMPARDRLEALLELAHEADLEVRVLSASAAAAENVPLPSLNVWRDRLIGAVAHGDGEKDWAVVGREQARAANLE